MASLSENATARCKPNALAAWSYLDHRTRRNWWPAFRPTNYRNIRCSETMLLAGKLCIATPLSRKERWSFYQFLANDEKALDKLQISDLKKRLYGLRQCSLFWKANIGYWYVNLDRATPTTVIKNRRYWIRYATEILQSAYVPFKLSIRIWKMGWL